jgi:REP element-mobilizing transposase RayT
MVGHHVIFGAYGFWLPNDPRGSWSDFVGSWDLFRYGPATKTDERRSVAYRKHDSSARRAAKTSLSRTAVQFTGFQARSIGNGFAEYVEKARLAVWACAILPDHAHLVIGRPHISVESIVIQLKASATRHLMKDGLHPFQGQTDRQGRTPKCFARGEWKVYLDRDDPPRAVRYVEANPEKEGKPRQHWSFVTPFLR